MFLWHRDVIARVLLVLYGVQTVMVSFVKGVTESCILSTRLREEPENAQTMRDIRSAVVRLGILVDR